MRYIPKETSMPTWFPAEGDSYENEIVVVKVGSVDHDSNLVSWSAKFKGNQEVCNYTLPLSSFHREMQHYYGFREDAAQ